MTPVDIEYQRAQRERIEALSVAIRWVALWTEAPTIAAQTLQALEVLLNSPHVSRDNLEKLCARWHESEWLRVKILLSEHYEELVAEAAKQGILGPS